VNENDMEAVGEIIGAFAEDGLLMWMKIIRFSLSKK
jgi:hypothetical protein